MKTNNKQQTAVEWFIEQLNSKYGGNDFFITHINEIEKAKEMEWDQINNAYLQGFNDNDCNPHEDTFNLYYYQENYGGGEQ
jgi:hypothetical protein